MICPECEKEMKRKKLMVFIGYVDKDTQEEMPTFGMAGGKCRVHGALSGVLRKFRCHQGHVVIE